VDAPSVVVTGPDPISVEVLTDPTFTVGVQVDRYEVETVTLTHEVTVTPDTFQVEVGAVGIQGPPGPAGGYVTATTGQIIGGHRLVTVDNDGRVIYADALDPNHLGRPMWLSEAAWDADTVGTFRVTGPVTEPSWDWTPGKPLFLGVNGSLTHTPPPGGLWRRVAEVITPTTIVVGADLPIARAGMVSNTYGSYGTGYGQTPDGGQYGGYATGYTVPDTGTNYGTYGAGY